MENSKNYRICIVEDRTDLREAMGMMVQHTDGFDLVAAYSNAEEALEKMPLQKPDAVLMDINLSEISGIECTATLKNQLPKTLFLMCTAFEDTEKIFDSLKAGASGYILKTEGPVEIMSALTEMLNGGSPMSMAIARKVVMSFSKQKIKNPALQKLTDRETDVLEKLSKGYMNKEVADLLNISPATVRTHIQNIYSKLHVNTRVEAVNIYLNR